MKNYLLLLLAGIAFYADSQNYDSYFTGNPTDLVTSPAGGVCLMGGATEDDNAMIWFLNQANGGDILVIRASGSDGYNNYFYSGLGVTVNSVESIVWNDASASDETYIHQKINQAEAIWIAGGDQWNYVSYWRDTPIDSLINKAIAERNIVIGGTSAGMAVLGQAYFTAENGTVTSATALNNPYDANVTVDTADFFNVPYMDWVITDTHYDSPDRKGRHAVFLARLMQDYNFFGYPGIPYGIACDEYTAVCVDTNGLARVFGGYPTYDDYAYFIRTYCGDVIPIPSNCSPGMPLEWGFGLLACRVEGTATGAFSFNLNDWETETGGDWFDWQISSGTLTEYAIFGNYVCDMSSDNYITEKVQVFPNPSDGIISVSGTGKVQNLQTKLFSMEGKYVASRMTGTNGEIDYSDVLPGTYMLIINSGTGIYRQLITLQ